jgi:hypothetical protein
MQLRGTTIGTTTLDEWSAQNTDLYLTTHKTYKIQTSTSQAGFEPTIPANVRPHTHVFLRHGHWDWISKGRITEITAKLDCFKICAEWMPQMLTNTYETKKGRVTLFLHQYYIQGEGFWLQIVIGDKPGSTIVNPNQSGHWCKGTYMSSPRKRNSRVHHQLE